MERLPRARRHAGSPAGTSGPLSFRRAERVDREALIHQAIGVLMHRLDLCSEDASSLLSSSAAVAELDQEHLAEAILEQLDKHLHAV
jgi:hypothetical protein